MNVGTRGSFRAKMTVGGTSGCRNQDKLERLTEVMYRMVPLGCLTMD